MVKKKTKEKEKFYVTDNNPLPEIESQNPIIVRGDDITTPEELFSNESGSNDSGTVVKELFNPKNPKIRSEFSDREIKILSRLYSLSEMIYEKRGTYILKATLDEFVLERMSKDRQSRKEFVEAHKEVKKESSNFLNNMLGMK